MHCPSPSSPPGKTRLQTSGSRTPQYHAGIIANEANMNILRVKLGHSSPPPAHFTPACRSPPLEIYGMRLHSDLRRTACGTVCPPHVGLSLPAPTTPLRRASAEVHTEVYVDKPCRSSRHCKNPVGSRRELRRRRRVHPWVSNLCGARTPAPSDPTRPSRRPVRPAKPATLRP